jgi:hypothetical protein
MTTSENLIFALFLAAAAVAPAQQPAGPTGPVPNNLDEMIATALKTSPEVLLAEAKLRQAQAELNEVRLRVTREVVGAFNDKKHKQSALVVAERQLQLAAKAAEQGAKQGAPSTADVEQARAHLGGAELGIAQADATIRYLLGVGSQFDLSLIRAPVATESAKPRTIPRPPVPDALDEALNREITVKFDKTPLSEVVKTLTAQAGVSVLVDPLSRHDGLEEMQISLTLAKPVTVTTAFQALADNFDLFFLLRDYGILVTSESRAREIRAPVIPDVPLDADAR